MTPVIITSTWCRPGTALRARGKPQCQFRAGQAGPDGAALPPLAALGD
ncbi:MAG: hypothetical protein HPM95_20520 [Alphaproteobacteria bacterium]|nr:hypothetical protein [Alphaproteobacteria bacterium]